MSERERWIVYPLLFLALGAALRDKLTKRSVTDHMICKRLSVVDENYDPVAWLLVSPPTEGEPAAAARLIVSGQIRAKQVVADNLERRQAADTSNWATMLNWLQRMGVMVRAAPLRQEPGSSGAPPSQTDSPGQPAGPAGASPPPAEP